MQQKVDDILTTYFLTEDPYDASSALQQTSNLPVLRLARGGLSWIPSPYIDNEVVKCIIYACESFTTITRIKSARIEF